MYTPAVLEISIYSGDCIPCEFFEEYIIPQPQKK